MYGSGAVMCCVHTMVMALRAPLVAQRGCGYGDAVGGWLFLEEGLGVIFLIRVLLSISAL